MMIVVGQATNNGGDQQWRQATNNGGYQPTTANDYPPTLNHF